MGIEQLIQEYAVTIRWRAFPLHPDTPTEGMSLEHLFARSSTEIKAMIEQQWQTAHKLGLPFGTRTMTYNSRLAQETGLWAQDKGKGELFHKIAFRAYFRDGQNLGLPAIIIKIVTESGLPAHEAEKMLAARKYATAVDNDWQKSRSLGITAVPTILFANQRLTGYHSYDRVEHLLRSSGATKRSNR